jgi:hypothetical protein
MVVSGCTIDHMTASAARQRNQTLSPDSAQKEVRPVATLVVTPRCQEALIALLDRDLTKVRSKMPNTPGRGRLPKTKTPSARNQSDRTGSPPNPIEVFLKKIARRKQARTPIVAGNTR